MDHFDGAIALVALVAACGSRSILDASCTTGQTTCASTCADVSTDPNNCGACGNACPAGEVCSAGTCATSCGGGTTQCGESCVDTRFDPHHCGNCSTACPAGLACVEGACGGSTCGKDQTLCTPASGAYCASTQSDNANCGACGKTCPAWMPCVAGVCTTECAPGRTACGADCVDLQSDVKNCGTCGTTCDVCSSGRCIVEIAAPTGVSAYGVVADKSGVYWVDQYGVYSVGLQPPFTKNVVYENASAAPFIGVAADATGTVYWTNLSGVMSYNGSIAYLAVSNYAATSIALDSSNAYWYSKIWGTIRSVPKGGGSVTTWANGAMFAALPHALATDGAYLYWTSAGSIMAMPSSSPDAGSPTVLVSGEGEPGPIAVDAQNVYWVAQGLRAVAKGGGTPWTIAALPGAHDLAIDASNAYLVNFVAGVTRIALGTGASTTLVPPSIFGGGFAGDSIGIAIDSSSVYWTMYSGPYAGSVWKVTPK